MVTRVNILLLINTLSKICSMKIIGANIKMLATALIKKIQSNSRLYLKIHLNKKFAWNSFPEFITNLLIGLLLNQRVITEVLRIIIFFRRQK